MNHAPVVAAAQPPKAHPHEQLAALPQRELLRTLATRSEQLWLGMAQVAESMHDVDRAREFYERALRHNPDSATALTCLGSLARARGDHAGAIRYFVRLTQLDPSNGEVWGALGHCHLQLDELQEAYHAYQQALYHLRDPKNPSLWYGIGVLYDRYGSWQHAEEAFSSVLQMDPAFEKRRDILYRLGLLYRQQRRLPQALACFEQLRESPPDQLSKADILVQLALVHMLESSSRADAEARACLERALALAPAHMQALQELAWLHHAGRVAGNDGDARHEAAVALLQRALAAEPAGDGLVFYLLGRCYMAQRDYVAAYDVFERCIRFEPHNADFWLAIGVLYHQIHQFRDALDAYTRAIRLNAYAPQVWANLGALYETSNNQTRDALESFEKSLAIDPQQPDVRAHCDAIVRVLRSATPDAPVGVPPPPPRLAFPPTLRPVVSDGQASSGVPVGAQVMVTSQPQHAITAYPVASDPQRPVTVYPAPVGLAPPRSVPPLKRAPEEGAPVSEAGSVPVDLAKRTRIS